VTCATSTIEPNVTGEAVKGVKRFCRRNATFEMEWKDLRGRKEPLLGFHRRLEPKLK
jgi:hypothetical protein